MQPVAASYKGFLFTSSAMHAIAKMDASVGCAKSLGEGWM